MSDSTDFENTCAGDRRFGGRVILIERHLQRARQRPRAAFCTGAFMARQIGLVILASVTISACGTDSGSSNETGLTPGVRTVDAASPKIEGPFGIDLATPFERLAIDKDGPNADRGLYVLKSVPKPNSTIETVSVVAFPGVGICEIRASSLDFDGDSMGSQTESAIDRFAEILETKYGKPTKFDKCGGIMCDPPYWAMAVMNGERLYSYEWKGLKGGGATPRAVSIWSQASQLAVPYFRLDYSFNDAKKCADAEKKLGAANL